MGCINSRVQSKGSLLKPGPNSPSLVQHSIVRSIQQSSGNGNVQTNCQSIGGILKIKPPCTTIISLNLTKN